MEEDATDEDATDEDITDEVHQPPAHHLINFPDLLAKDQNSTKIFLAHLPVNNIKRAVVAKRSGWVGLGWVWWVLTVRKGEGRLVVGQWILSIG